MKITTMLFIFALVLLLGTELWVLWAKRKGKDVAHKATLSHLVYDWQMKNPLPRRILTGLFLAWLFYHWVLQWEY